MIEKVPIDIDAVWLAQILRDQCADRRQQHRLVRIVVPLVGYLRDRDFGVNGGGGHVVAAAAGNGGGDGFCGVLAN